MFIIKINIHFIQWMQMTSKTSDSEKDRGTHLADDASDLLQKKKKQTGGKCQYIDPSTYTQTSVCWFRRGSLL